jgi:hypothetical protein
MCKANALRTLPNCSQGHHWVAAWSQDSLQRHRHRPEPCAGPPPVAKATGELLSRADALLSSMCMGRPPYPYPPVVAKATPELLHGAKALAAARTQAICRVPAPHLWPRPPASCWCTQVPCRNCPDHVPAAKLQLRLLLIACFLADALLTVWLLSKTQSYGCLDMTVAVSGTSIRCSSSLLNNDCCVTRRPTAPYIPLAVRPRRSSSTARVGLNCHVISEQRVMITTSNAERPALRKYGVSVSTQAVCSSLLSLRRWSKLQAVVKPSGPAGRTPAMSWGLQFLRKRWFFEL